MLGLGSKRFFRELSSIFNIGIILDLQIIFEKWRLLKVIFILRMIPMLNMLGQSLKKLFKQRPSICKRFYLQNSSDFEDNLQIKDDPNAEHAFKFFEKVVQAKAKHVQRFLPSNVFTFLKIIFRSRMIPMLIWSFNFANTLPSLAFTWPSLNAAWNLKISTSSWM